MLLPKEALRACDELYERNPTLAHGDDNQRRRLTRMIAEQIAFVLGDRWGCKKRAGLGDDWQSKDAIAFLEDDGTVSVWDWQSGATRRRVVNEGDPPTYPRLPQDEATFMPVLQTNHLDWPEGVHTYQGDEQADQLCEVCHKRHDDPIHRKAAPPRPDDLVRRVQELLEPVVAKLQSLDQRVDDLVASFARSENYAVGSAPSRSID
jgi:hypothetical protein